MKPFNIDCEDHYEYDKPKERTRSRLKEILDMGMQEVGYGEFGIKGVMSGLYIEKVWSYSDAQFKDYLEWVKELINNFKKIK